VPVASSPFVTSPLGGAGPGSTVRRLPATPAPLVSPLPVAAPEDERPVLRLLPAPACEPPYDDELPAGRALRAVPARPSAAPVLLRLVPRGPLDAGALLADPDEEPGARTPLAQLPPARPFAHALVQRLLEVLAGLRPVSQLQRDTSFELFLELEQVVACHTAARRRHAERRPTRRDVRSVHVQARADGVAEVCATVRRGGRTTALALRLEGVGGAWCCTALLGV
jgi:hypothetical protein